MILYASKRLLKKSPYKTYIKWGVNAALFVFFVRLFSLIYTKISLNSYFSLILHATVVCLLVIPAFFIAASVVDRESFKYCVEFFKNHMKK